MLSNLHFINSATHTMEARRLTPILHYGQSSLIPNTQHYLLFNSSIYHMYYTYKKEHSVGEENLTPYLPPSHTRTCDPKTQPTSHIPSKHDRIPQQHTNPCPSNQSCMSSHLAACVDCLPNKTCGNTKKERKKTSWQPVTVACSSVTNGSIAVLDTSHLNIAGRIYIAPGGTQKSITVTAFIHLLCILLQLCFYFSQFFFLVPRGINTTPPRR
ncbi:unnamed protein product [Periconia digitata]|uniref:Uncharacterized protein n=1 Tax=Periconia digitata TaxID=1303443 RepID=A0A9W4ULC3_9PLEO|nr:unnamed protein product [Periconia digitata]